MKKMKQNNAVYSASQSQPTQSSQPQQQANTAELEQAKQRIRELENTIK